MRPVLLLLLLSAVGGAESEPEMRKRLKAVREGLPKTVGELEKLLPAWKAAAQSDPKLVRVYHAAVSLGRANKLAADYLMRPVEFAELEGKKRTFLAFDLPRGGRWEYDREKKQAVHVDLADGSRKIRVVIYAKAAPADALKAYAQELRDPKGGAPAPRLLNKHVGKCPGIDLRGLDEKGKAVRIRAWLLPGKKGTFHAALIEARERDPQTDYELEAILASIREPK